MSRRFGWAMLIAAAMVLGCALGSYERTHAAGPAARDADAEEREMDVGEQLKDIKTQVKEINTLLHSGTLKVVVVINPDRK
jgi:hypothetical protein